MAKKMNIERTITTTTSIPSPVTIAAVGWWTKNMDTPTATKKRLLTSHTKEPSKNFNHLMEESFVSSRL